MNRIFKAVWNESSGAWVAASETSKSKTKRSSSAKLGIAQAAMIGGLLAAAPAHAQASDDWAAPKAGLMAAPKVSGVYAYAAGENAVANGDQATAIGASSKADNLLASAATRTRPHRVAALPPSEPSPRQKAITPRPSAPFRKRMAKTP